MWFSCGVHNFAINSFYVVLSLSINKQLVAISAHVKILNGSYSVAMKILLYLESMDS